MLFSCYTNYFSVSVFWVFVMHPFKNSAVCKCTLYNKAALFLFFSSVMDLHLSHMGCHCQLTWVGFQLLQPTAVLNAHLLDVSGVDLLWWCLAGSKIGSASSQTSTTRCGLKTTCASCKSTAPTTTILALTCAALSTTLDPPPQRPESECRVSCTSVCWVNLFLLFLSLLCISSPPPTPHPSCILAFGRRGRGRSHSIIQLCEVFCLGFSPALFAFVKGKWCWVPCSCILFVHWSDLQVHFTVISRRPVSDWIMF